MYIIIHIVFQAKRFHASSLNSINISRQANYVYRVTKQKLVLNVIFIVCVYVCSVCECVCVHTHIYTHTTHIL